MSESRFVVDTRQELWLNDCMTTKGNDMNARQIARRKNGTSVTTTANLGGSGFAHADGTTRWTTAGSVNGHLVLEGRTADKVFVPLDSDVTFEVA